MNQRFGLVGDRYQLRGQLGHGGMGRVWLARDEMLDRDVAVKEVAPPANLSPEEAKQLRILIDREARAAARINHPNVVKIFDVLQTAEWPWLIMEYVPSSSLQRVVQQDGPMAPADVAGIGLAVLDALNAAHDAGVLHRDVKPDNVLLADDGRVMLSDFGLASLDTDGKVTRSGTLGTPQYVAPERARWGVSSREADLWSLGATLYAAVEGRSPYQRESVLETLSALAVDPPDPMRLAGPLEPVISGLLQRDPAYRTHPDHLAEQLRTVIAGGQVPPVPAMPAVVAPLPVAASPQAASRLQAHVTPQAQAPQQPRTKSRAALIGAGGVTLAVVVGLILANRSGTLPVAAPSSSPSAALSTMPCENTPAQALPIPIGPPPHEHETLPKGWTWYAEGGAPAVGVPEEWNYWRMGNNVCFRDPYGSRVMAIFLNRVPAEAYPGYHMISRTDIMLRGPATEWEFTFTGAQRTRHAIALVTEGPTLLWTTDEFDFSISRALYDVAKVSFDAHPGGPGQQQEPPPPRPTGSPGGRP